MIGLLLALLVRTLVADRAGCLPVPAAAVARLSLPAGIRRRCRIHDCCRHRVDDNVRVRPLRRPYSVNRHPRASLPRSPCWGPRWLRSLSLRCLPSGGGSEAALRASEARLRSILDAANVIAWDVDLIRNAVHPAGPVAAFCNGRRARCRAILREWSRTIHPDDRDRVMAQFWTAVSTAATYRFEFRLNSDRFVLGHGGGLDRARCAWPAGTRAWHHPRHNRAQEGGAVAG